MSNKALKIIINTRQQHIFSFAIFEMFQQN